MSGFVVCPSCGTRIKAGREHCLRCFEPLPDPDVPVQAPLSVSLGLSSNAQTTIWIGGAAVAVVLLVAIWQTWPVADDDLARSANLSTPPAAAAQSPSAPAPAPASSELRAADGSGGADNGSPDPALEASRAEYELKLTGRPKDPVLLNQLGQLLERMGRADEAAAHFERAVAIAPLETTYRLNLARVASALGQWDRAVNQYREAVRLRPKDYDALTDLGRALQKKGDDQSAVAEFTKAQRINPAAPDATLGLATSLEKVGRVDEAVLAFKQYLEIRPAPANAEQVRAHLSLLSRSRPQVK